MSKISNIADAKPRLSVVDRIQWPDITVNGGPRHKSQANILHFLQIEGVTLRYNAFALKDEICRDGRTVEVSDADVIEMHLRAHALGLDPPIAFFENVLTNQARANSHHPIRDYLNSLHWDGEQRLETWLHDYAGAADTEFVRTVGVKTLLAAVRRVRKPGCKFDQCLVLEGTQGRGKSSLVAILAGENAFTDCLTIGADAKAMIEQTAGKWLVEMAELSGIRKGEVEPVKAMLSRTSDRARLAYGKRAADVPRQFILFGTTNDSAYLRDQTGNRRFWPVKVGQIDLPGLQRVRDQLWAEAAFREAQGEPIELPEVLYDVASQEQAQRMIADPWEERLAPALDGKEGHIESEDIWTFLDIKADKRDPHTGQRVTQIMARLGFEKTRRRRGGSALPAYSNNKANAFFSIGQAGSAGTVRTLLGTD